MKILNIQEWLRPVICFSHKWQRNTGEGEGQVELTCERCGKKKSWAKSRELLIMLPEQFRGEKVSDNTNH